eukprot:s2111_g10.t1
MEGETDKQTCLLVHDRAAKMMTALPTPQKGGKRLQYLTTEVTKSIVYTQHREIAVPTDRYKPSVLALADAVRRTCRNLYIAVHDEGATVGDHQSNGAEVTVQILRAKAALLVQQIEDRVAVDGGGLDVHGQKRSDETGDGDSHKRAKFADAAFSLLEESFLVDDSEAGKQAPKSPKLDDDAYKRRVNQVTSTDLSLHEHEDQPVSFSFENEDIECLEDYEFTFGDDEFCDDSICTDEEALKQLTFPYGKHEPVKRLTSVGVLTVSASMPADCKTLSTRFVRTWREKLNAAGEQIWLRRSLRGKGILLDGK